MIESNGVCKKAIAGAEESSPMALFWQLSFWWKNKLFLLSLVLIIFFIVFVMFSSFQDWTEIAPYIALAIYGMVFWGAYMTANILANLEVEQAIVCNVQDALSNYKQENQPKDLERLASALLPTNYSNPQPQTLHMFVKILEEANDHRFDTSHGAVTPYQEALVNQMFDLRNVQTLGLRMGIMGTFLGLLYGLAEFSGVFQDNNQFDASAERILSTLKLAFGTSVAGLIVSVTITIFIILVRNRHKMLFRSMESAVVDMISAASNAVNNKSFYGNELRALRHKMDKQQERMHELSIAVEKASERVAPWVQQQKDILQQGIEQLARGKGSFDKYLATQQEIIEQSSSLHKKTINTFELQLDKLNQANNNLLENTISKLENKSEIFANSFQDALEKFDNKSRVAYQENTEKLSQTLRDVQSALLEHPSRTTLENMNKRLNESFQMQGEDLNRMLESIQSAIQKNQENWGVVNSAIKDVSDIRKEEVRSTQIQLEKIEASLNQQSQISQQTMESMVSVLKEIKVEIRKNQNANERKGFFGGVIKLIFFIMIAVAIVWLVNPTLVENLLLNNIRELYLQWKS